MELARAVQGEAQAADDLTVLVEGQLRWTDPNEVSPYGNDDNSVTLRASKNLYDSGYTGALQAAADHALAGQEWRYLDARQQRRLQIMARYFDVLRADLTFARDDEAMAVAYVAFDKARDRNELGQLSDIEMLRLESDYQEARVRRFTSDAERRASRTRLALALNRPDDLPATLLEPELPELDWELPPLDEVWSGVEAGNATLSALRESLEGARQSLAAARSEDGPTLSGELEVSEYSRDTPTRDDALVGLRLRVPLFDGGRSDAALGRAQAELHQLQAQLAEETYRLRQAVVEVWNEIDNLGRQREQMRVLGDYRELYLDRSRALYELNAATDLGDAMVQVTDARLRSADTDYRLAQAWARLQALSGALVAQPAAGDAAGDGEAVPEPVPESGAVPDPSVLPEPAGEPGADAGPWVEPTAMGTVTVPARVESERDESQRDDSPVVVTGANPLADTTNATVLALPPVPETNN